MYKKILIAIPVLVILAGAFFYLQGSSDKITWKNISDGFEQGKNQNKKIVISVYTDWCQYCKMMEKEVYSDPAVIDYINENFVAVKLNAESEKKSFFDGKMYKELEIAGGLGVDSYPSTIFFDQNQQALGKIPGYIDKATFMQMLKFVKEEKYNKESFEEYQKRQ